MEPSALSPDEGSGSGPGRTAETKAEAVFVDTREKLSSAGLKRGSAFTAEGPFEMLLLLLKWKSLLL